MDHINQQTGRSIHQKLIDRSLVDWIHTYISLFLSIYNIVWSIPLIVWRIKSYRSIGRFNLPGLFMWLCLIWLIRFRENCSGNACAGHNWAAQFCSSDMCGDCCTASGCERHDKQATADRLVHTPDLWIVNADHTLLLPFQRNAHKSDSLGPM